MRSYDNLDFFDPSTTDGFNIPLTITPGTGCEPLRFSDRLSCSANSTEW